MPNEIRSAGTTDRLLSALLYPLPHHWISRLVLYFTRLRTPLKNPAIRWFIRHFRVDMSQAVLTEPQDFASFNEFFTRRLRPEARPLAGGSDTLISPVDGTISQIGAIEKGSLLQAKGRDYSVFELLGADAGLAAEFDNGSFTTIYLSPRDYHRIHMPLDGQLRRMLHVPGRLFSVAPHTVRCVPRLFARNERVVSIFDSADGPFAMVLVGAINVAAIETVWHGLVTPPHRKQITSYDYSGKNICLLRGDEMGCFNLGSTVILLTQRRIDWLPQYGCGDSLRFGQRLATLPSLASAQLR